MIFISKNENGEPACKLIQEGRKTVTRRLKPISIGKILAIQPGRGKKSIGFIRIISCESSMNYFQNNAPFNILANWKQKEARLEGFDSWDGLMRWFQEHNIQFMDTFRIEFEYIGHGDVI